MSGSFGAQVVLDPASPAALGARGGAASTIHGNTVARDLGLISNGLDPLLTAGPPNVVVPFSLNFMRPGWLDPGVTFTRASTATYTDASGVVQTAAINAPRWDYAGGSLRGLLIEEARTNSLSVSVPDAGALWSASGPIAKGGSVVAPNGATSTTSLFSSTDTSNNVRQVGIPGSVASASTAYTITAFLKKSPINAYIQVNITGSATVVPIAYFDLTNGTAVVGADLIAGATGVSASITPYPDGWYRARITFTTNAGATGVGGYIGPCVTVSATGDNRSYVGVVGQGIYAWGAQVEQGAFATSYIPTTAGAVTRAVDSCRVLPASMGWFTAGPGSWFAEFISQTTPTPSANRIIGYPVVNGKTPLYIGTTNQIGVYDGNAVVTSANTFVRDAVAKAVSTWTASTGKICLNGGAVASGSETTGFLDAASSGIALLQTGTAVESSTGYIRRLSWWPRVLSDAEMQGITA